MVSVNALVYPGGRTNTYEGLTLALGVLNGPGSRPRAQKIVIVITDGVPTVNPELTEGAALALQQVARVFAVGVTDQISEGILRTLSSQPQLIGETYFTSATFQGLDVVLDQVLEQTCLVPTTVAPVTNTPGKTLWPSPTTPGKILWPQSPPLPTLPVRHCGHSHHPNHHHYQHSWVR